MFLVLGVNKDTALNVVWTHVISTLTDDVCHLVLKLPAASQKSKHYENSIRCDGLEACNQWQKKFNIRGLRGHKVKVQMKDKLLSAVAELIFNFTN